VDQPPADALSWVYNPWRANWRRPAVALVLELLIAVLAGVSFTWPDWWPAMLGWGGIGFLLLVGMTMSLYLPVRYTLDDKGVMVRFFGAPSFRRWEHYRNYYPHDSGVHLTTMPQPSALDPFRGHFLLYDGNKREVDAYIAHHMTQLGQPEERKA